MHEGYNSLRICIYYFSYGNNFSIINGVFIPCSPIPVFLHSISPIIFNKGFNINFCIKAGMEPLHIIPDVVS